MSKPYRDSKGRFRKRPHWIITILVLVMLYGLLSIVLENIGTILIVVAAVAAVIVAVILLRRHLKKKDAASQEAVQQAEIAAKRYICQSCGADTIGPNCEYCGKPVK